MSVKKNIKMEISVTDMHTGGEPLRIITEGFPEIKGDTILEKRSYTKENLDQYRKFLMFEPRGHFDMYGALLVEPDLKEADVAVLFFHNEGYSTMCGHAVMALGRYIVDNKLMKDTTKIVDDGIVETNIQCPCGLVTAEVSINAGVTGDVSFVSIPAFVYMTDIEVELPTYGKITFDISYGGAFYALVDVTQAKLHLRDTPINELVHFSTTLTDYIKKNMEIKHPVEEDLGFLYGSIMTDGKDVFGEDGGQGTKNVCVFADRQVDRAPTGSGVTARIAAQFAKNQIGLNQKRIFINGKTDSAFTGEAVEKTKCGTFEAVRVKVTGQAFYTGTSKFFREENDPSPNGFLIH